MSHDYCKFLENFPGQVITAEPVPTVKNCAQMDVNYLVDKYGPYFFTSSLSWMFALAIEAGATTIGLWGVDMAATEEYGYQRAGCQYFAMLAKSMGIEVGVPPESDLLRPPPLYGICETSHDWIKITARHRELADRRAQAEQKILQGQEELKFLQGATDDLLWVQQTWMGTVESNTKRYTEPPLVPALLQVAKPQKAQPEDGAAVMDSELSSVTLSTGEAKKKPAKKKAKKKAKRKVTKKKVKGKEVVHITESKTIEPTG